MKSKEESGGDNAPFLTSTTPHTTTLETGPPRNPVLDDHPGHGSTDTIAAITVALLAVLIIISILVICRAIRKRRQAQRGQELTHIPTISTGIMGTPVSAYGNIPVQGRVSWESVHTQSTEPDPMPGPSGTVSTGHV